MNLSVPSLLAASLLVLSAAAPVRAGEGKWQRHHPRRVEVNQRLKNQDKRINQGVKNGKLTPKQARQLHKKEHQIRQEERDMAAQDHGHVTKQEQKAINQQENQTSRQIYRKKH